MTVTGKAGVDQWRSHSIVSVIFHNHRPPSCPLQPLPPLPPAPSCRPPGAALCPALHRRTGTHAMPVPLRANHHRAEAKYNVTTECECRMTCSDRHTHPQSSSKPRSPFCSVDRQCGPRRICPVTWSARELSRRRRPPAPCRLCRRKRPGRQATYRVRRRCQCPTVSTRSYCSDHILGFLILLLHVIPAPPNPDQASKTLLE